MSEIGVGTVVIGSLIVLVVKSSVACNHPSVENGYLNRRRDKEPHGW